MGEALDRCQADEGRWIDRAIWRATRSKNAHGTRATLRRRPASMSSVRLQPDQRSRMRLGLLYPEVIDLYFSHVVHAEPDDAIGCRFELGLRHRVHDGTVHDVGDRVARHAHFEYVDRLAGGVRLLDRRAGRVCLDVSRHLARALLDQERAVLRDGEVGVALLSAFETLAAEHEAVEVGVIAWFEQRERTLGDKVAHRRR